jgi:ribose-phosphate pyrophosphokinase
MKDSLTIFSGTANPPLASEIAAGLGVQLGACAIDRYPDGEVSVQLLEPVRRKQVYLVQPMAPPVNDNLVELLALADACRRAAAARVTAVVPYFGYARADKRHERLEPITGRMMADLLQAVGIAHVITMDPHTPQIEGFFFAPTDTLTAVPALCRAFKGRLPSYSVVVSPDTGRTQLATRFAECLGIPVIMLHKRRESAQRTEVTHVVGEVRNRACVIVDDMIATGGTIAGSITALLQAGARPEFIVAATHGLFLSGAREKLDHAGVRSVFVTDTTFVREKNWPKLRVVSIASLIASAVERYMGDSLGDSSPLKTAQVSSGRRHGTHTIS